MDTIRTVPILVQAAHTLRTGFEQSGPHCRSRQAKGILSFVVTHSYAVPSCDSRVCLQREAAGKSSGGRAGPLAAEGRAAARQPPRHRPHPPPEIRLLGGHRGRLAALGRGAARRRRRCTMASNPCRSSDTAPAAPPEIGWLGGHSCRFMAGEFEFRGRI